MSICEPDTIPVDGIPAAASRQANATLAGRRKSMYQKRAGMYIALSTIRLHNAQPRRRPRAYFPPPPFALCLMENALKSPLNQARGPGGAMSSLRTCPPNTDGEKR